MSLKIGIIGLPNVGKSTLFKALTREKVDIANFPFTTIDPNIGIVEVPDERLSKIAAITKAKRIIPPIIEFVDIAGLVKGAYQGAGLGNQFLSHIREVDAIVEVVRAFKNPDIIHVEENTNPKRDIETIQLELAMADLQTINKHLVKNEKNLKGNSPRCEAGQKRAQEEKIILERIRLILEAGDPATKANLEQQEIEFLKDLNLLTLKPFIFVFNISDKKTGENFCFDASKHRNIYLDLKFEAELAEMPEEEAQEFKKESRLDDLTKTAYEILELITFFSIKSEEVRGWTIKAGIAVPASGAAIHTDFRDKFIRAEVINWQKLLECGSWANARAQGLLRTEGKEYIVSDGDVIEFKI